MKDSREEPHGDPVICRCESIGWKQLQQAIRQSRVTTVNQLKKITRAGMGLCQGRTCAKAVERIIEIETGIPVGTEPYRSRPPVRTISIASLAESADHYTEPPGPVSVVMLRTSASSPPKPKSDTEEAE